MKLYVGGAFQGQLELAIIENPGAEVVENFNAVIREAVAGGKDPRSFAREYCADHPEQVIVADEVGAGVVPIRPEDRAYREAVGRVLCVIAQNSESVVRAVCGIGVRIK